MSKGLAGVVLAILLTTTTPRFSLGQSTSDSVAIQFQSPIAEARYVLPTATVIIRPSAAIDPSTLNSTYLFRVAGSITGTHSGTTLLSDDDHEVIFKPDVQFAYGETVAVVFEGSLRTMLDHPIASTHFRFYVGKEIPNAGQGSPKFSEDPLGHFRAAEDLPETIHQAGPFRDTEINDTLPLDFPHITTSLTGETAPGYIFLANNPTASSSPYLMIVDNDGNPVFYRKMNGWCIDFKIQPTGQLSYYDLSTGKFYLTDSSFTITDSISCGDGYATDAHELRFLSNGHALLLGDDPEQVDMSSIVPGGNPSAIVTGIIIQELDSQRNVVFQWRSWDHFQITDATHEDLTAATIDYVHSNALELDTDGNILLSSRHMDEITKIDRTTGQILWRWGGKHNQFTVLNDSIGFSHQHAIRLLQDGDLVLFDNGNFHTPNFSRAVEYSFDETQKTATLVWQYRNTPDIYGSAMGYVQRLPNGNTLIGWGTGSTAVTEIAPDGSKVFQLSFDPGIFSYRAYRFVWNRNTTLAARTIPSGTSLSQNYPNPFNGETTFQIDLANPAMVTFKVYDVLGREVISVLDNDRRDAGLYSETLDFSRLPSGVYFCRLTADAFSETRKLLLTK